jgi:TIR domain
MPTIVISYRRADSSAIAGRMFDRLTARYGEQSVFMDIDHIPFGADFRTHMQEMLQRADVVIAVIGPNWLGVGADGATRMREPTDPIRVEIETAVARKTPIIPVLVDGARMPQSADLPKKFGNFAFLNAAEVATGRDFRTHVDRLIAAIDRTVAGGACPPASRSTASRRPDARDAERQEDASVRGPWLTDAARYFLVPLLLLLAAHHIIINTLDLNTEYLWIASAIIPFAFGGGRFWLGGRGVGPAFAFAITLGVIAVVGMTVSQSLNSGDPIMPQTRFEWWDNFNVAALIALSFLAGHVLARSLRATRRWRFGRS